MIWSPERWFIPPCFNRQSDANENADRRRGAACANCTSPAPTPRPHPEEQCAASPRITVRGLEGWSSSQPRWRPPGASFETPRFARLLRTRVAWDLQNGLGGGATL